MKQINLYNLFKNNSLALNLISILIIFYPISIVVGPAIIEVTILISILLGLFAFKLNTIKDFFYKFDYKLLIIFYILIILSSLLSDNILFSLKSSFFSIRFFLFSIIILIILSNNKILSKTFFFVGIIFVSISVFDGYIQLIFDRNIFFFDTSSDIITGFFFDEKKLGRYLITLSPILVGLYFSLNTRNINKKIIIAITYLNFIFFLILFTSERVSMFYCIFTILITILYGYKLSKKYVLFIFLPVFLFFSSYFAGLNNFDQTINNSINQITNNNKNFSYPSTQHRSFMYTSYELFKDNPTLGIGPNNFRNKCKDIKVKNTNNCSTHPHNIFFQIMVETGLFGIIIYIYFLFKLVKELFRFIFSKEVLKTKIFFLLPVLYFFNPFFPSGNFFNNWFMAIGTFGIPFYLYFNENRND